MSDKRIHVCTINVDDLSRFKGIFGAGADKI
jgi:hypothetical protein